MEAARQIARRVVSQREGSDLPRHRSQRLRRSNCRERFRAMLEQRKDPRTSPVAKPAMAASIQPSRVNDAVSFKHQLDAPREELRSVVTALNQDLST